MDKVMDGLWVFGLKEAVQVFPTLFSSIFVAPKQCTPKNVIDVLHYQQELRGSRKRISEYLETSIAKLNESGVYANMAFTYVLADPRGGWTRSHDMQLLPSQQ